MVARILVLRIFTTNTLIQNSILCNKYLNTEQSDMHIQRFTIEACSTF